MWVDVPVDKVIELFTKLKKAAPIDVEIKLETTGEQAKWVRYERNVKILTTYGSNSPYDFTQQRIEVGSWNQTDKFKWVNTGMLKRTRPVDTRFCVPTC